MELPFWLAEELAASRDVEIDLPSAFSLRSRAELRATARTVRAHARKHLQGNDAYDAACASYRRMARGL